MTLSSVLRLQRQILILLKLHTHFLRKMYLLYLLYLVYFVFFVPWISHPRVFQPKGFPEKRKQDGDNTKQEIETKEQEKVGKAMWLYVLCPCCWVVLHRLSAPLLAVSEGENTHAHTYSHTQTVSARHAIISNNLLPSTEHCCVSAV